MESITEKTRQVIISKSTTLVVAALWLIGGCTGQLFNQDLDDYNLALKTGKFEAQVILATKLLNQDPHIIALSQAQLAVATVGYQRLIKDDYLFADQQRLLDAQVVLAIAPQVEIAKHAQQLSEQQHSQRQQIEQEISELYRFETDFPTDFYRAPLHKKVSDTPLTLPHFVDQISDKFYLGALRKGLEQQPMNDYQLAQLLSHQQQALTQAILVRDQLAQINQSAKLPAMLAQTHQALKQIVSFNQQTMYYLLQSLIRSSMAAAQQGFEQIRTVAISQMGHGRLDDVWQKQIKPLSQRQWQAFEQRYLAQISSVRMAILPFKAASFDSILAQTYPNAMLGYKYFWPEIDLQHYRDQGPLRQNEAKQIKAVLDAITFTTFSGIEQSYQTLLMQDENGLPEQPI